LLLECDEVDGPEVVETVRAVMTGWDSGGVPLEVDVKAGLTCGSMVKWAKWLAGTAKQKPMSDPSGTVFSPAETANRADAAQGS
jgi:hypothetical protein